MSDVNETLGNWKTMGGDADARDGREALTMGDAVTAGEAGRVLLAGRYRVVKQLGAGGMGNVWLTEDEKLDERRVAIKMLPSVLAGKKGAYRQVKAEAMVAMKLSHPNIATVRSFEEDEGGNPFLVMDYIDGEGLDDILAERGPLGEEDTVRLLGPVAAALDYAHGKGVVHRDVKPGNVMVAKDGMPYVLDFGIARKIQETLTRVTGKLSSGTLLYMSPDQLNGDVPKAAQDVYSFAAMAYECLTGAAPFARGQIEWQIVNKTPGGLPESIGEALRKGVMAGLAKAPEGRPGSCAGVLGEETGKNSESRFADSENRGMGSERRRKEQRGEGIKQKRTAFRGPGHGLVLPVPGLHVGEGADSLRLRLPGEAPEMAEKKGLDAKQNREGGGVRAWSEYETRGKQEMLESKWKNEKRAGDETRSETRWGRMQSDETPGNGFLLWQRLLLRMSKLEWAVCVGVALLCVSALGIASARGCRGWTGMTKDFVAADERNLEILETNETWGDESVGNLGFNPENPEEIRAREGDRPWPHPIAHFPEE